ncbi:hypothetical protein [Lacticaseibacillus porcinae]|uniref:hypothetical protein n=1 Tax=Lacticaseibacillus porcinae TaxID=1123687 RepID=UPI000F7A7533|nr:hypothetical protein [Lacticaseibacillus porcinae]
MKVGIETALALAAAGLLTTGQKVAADEQDFSSQPTVTAVGNQLSTTNEDTTVSDSVASGVTAPKATTSEPAATLTDAPASNHDSTALSSEAGGSDLDENQSSTSGDSSDTEPAVPTDPTIQQQLQSVVSTQLQADASAQVVAQRQSELDAKQTQYDQHQQALDTKAQAYTQAVDTYATEKDNFEAAQAKTQQLVQAHNEQTAQYQLEADAYNAAQQPSQQSTLAIQIAQYNASESTYQQALTTFATEQANFKQDLTSYQQALSTYDPKNTTDAESSTLQTRYQQLKTTQLQLQATAAAIKASQTQFANLYAQLQKAVQKDAPTAFDATKYEQLNAKRQALLAEAKELIARQASSDQNADRANALLTTYDLLNEQRDQLQVVDAQLTQEADVLYDSTAKLNDAQDRADADQDAADEAKEYARDHISSAIDDFIASLSSNQESNASATKTPDSIGNNTKHTLTAVAGYLHRTFAKPDTLQVLTCNIEMPMNLATRMTEITDLPSFTAPQTFSADDLLTAAILLPDAPTSKTETTVTKPVTRIVNVLDADSGAAVFAITINADDVALTLPAGYQLASRQISDVHADAANVTVRSAAGSTVVYVQKDAVVQSQTSQPHSKQSPTGTQTHEKGDSVVAADHRQKVTKVGPALSVNASHYYDNRTPQVDEVIKSAPAVSVSASEYYDHRGTITKVGPALSVSASEYYDHRAPEETEVSQTVPTVSVGASDDDDGNGTVTKVGPALSVSASDYYDNREPEKAEVTQTVPTFRVGASDDDESSETITKVGPALSVSAPDYDDHRQTAKIADADATVIDKGAKSSIVSAVETQTHNHSQRRPIQLSTARIINETTPSSSTPADVHFAQATTHRYQTRYPRTGERQTTILTTLGIGLLSAMMGISEIRRRSR